MRTTVHSQVGLLWLLCSSICILAPSGIRAEVVLEEDLVIGQDPDEVPLGIIADCAVSPTGEIYLLDTSEWVIKKYSARGEFLGYMGELGEGPGDLGRPSCLAVNREGQVYVAGAQGWIEILDPDGLHQGRIDRLSNYPAQSICVDDSGSVYVVAFDLRNRKMIHKYDAKTGERTASFGDSYAAGGDIDLREEASYASGSVACGFGQVYYVQSFPHELLVFNENGALLQHVLARAEESVPVPIAELTAQSISIHLVESFSRSVIPVSKNEVLTSLIYREPKTVPGYVDLYDVESGERVHEFGGDGPLMFFGSDSEHRIYASEIRDDVPVVVRYRLSSVERSSERH